ncbi:DUF3618 domain-containing protein [Isoptericola variabilis]|uniref:DUF3618 domain-containing protein n=1 Tax=Isoptericola variabilis (strain 225) TaxID=743718 RepID=F6FTF8_ISOV2|nr:DUF3618 domain-containing protein [Isoptericola variabilis]AEG43151.1 hypothetical protein Isova_0352 [Isoptericola variabilis 225]TWH35082.1 uncharacterized protein DUF3618 [Isoptericola variabilis J7]
MTENQPQDAAVARPPMSRRELEAEVVRSRAEVAATLDALTTRLSPSYQAAQLAQSTRRAASDAGTFVTGGGLPSGDARRSRNAKILLGVVALTATVVAVAVTRALRR